MRTKPDHWYIQSAVAPLRETSDGVEVMLVTSLKKKRWILPKGIVEPGMSPAESAAKEAWEEAGVKGTVADRSFGHYSTRKWGGVCRVDLFRLDVLSVSEEWLESDRRDRGWFTLEEAAKLLKNKEAAALLLKLGNPNLFLTVIRHAKAAREEAGQADFDRPLTARGKADATEGAKRLAEATSRPSVILTSPARRALKTAKVFERVLGGGVALLERPEIYEASVTDLLALLRDLPEELGHVALVGHNPGLSELVRTLARTPVEDLPTSGIVRLDLGVTDWRLIEPGGATVLEVLNPAREAEAT